MAGGDGMAPRSKTVKHIIRYEQKFKPEYGSEFKFISKLHAGETYAFCTLCRSCICIAHGERDGIETRYSKNCKSTCLLFCQYAVFSLLFLTIFGPKPYYCVYSNVGRSVVVMADCCSDCCTGVPEGQQERSDWWDGNEADRLHLQMWEQHRAGQEQSQCHHTRSVSCHR